MVLTIILLSIALLASVCIAIAHRFYLEDAREDLKLLCDAIERHTRVCETLSLEEKKRTITEIERIRYR